MFLYNGVTILTLFLWLMVNFNQETVCTKIGTRYKEDYVHVYVLTDKALIQDYNVYFWTIEKTIA